MSKFKGTGKPTWKSTEVKDAETEPKPTVLKSYSADGGQGDYKISGRIFLQIWYQFETLHVRVSEAENLAKAKPGCLSDPYVKLQLESDTIKHVKQKTTVVRNTTDPEFNQSFKFEKIPEEETDSTTLWVSVWDWDAFGRNLFLGETHIPLSSLNLKDYTENWYKLRSRKYIPDKEGKGKIIFSAKYDVVKRSLMVNIKRALGLVLCDPQMKNRLFVRSFLLPKQSPYKSERTSFVKNTSNPVWNQTIEHSSVTIEKLMNSRVLELTVWNNTGKDCNDFVGCVRLGLFCGDSNIKDLMDSTRIEAAHWVGILDHPGKKVTGCHELRPSIGRRTETYLDEEEEQYLQAEELSSSEEIKESQGGVISVCSSEGTLSHYYRITGRVLVKLKYKEKNLIVQVIRAENLAAASSSGFSDPYVKICLLQDEKRLIKWKTDVKQKNLDPIFKETFKCSLDESKWALYTLLVSVWDWNRSGMDKFLGDFKIKLSECSMTGSLHWCNLSPIDKEDNGEQSSSHVGKLKIGLKYQETEVNRNKKCFLHVRIIKAKLPHGGSGECLNCFVRIVLLPTMRSRQTNLVLNNGTLVWDQEFRFDNLIKNQLTSERALEVTVWAVTSMSNIIFMGGLRFGPSQSPGHASKRWMVSGEAEASHWNQMIKCQGSWVEKVQDLRTSLDFKQAVLAKLTEATGQNRKKESPSYPIFVDGDSKEDNEKDEKTEEPVDNNGWITIGLMFEELGTEAEVTYGRLHVYIKNAKDLKKSTDENSKCYVMVTLLPLSDSYISKRKTAAIKNICNPAWNEVLVYDNISLEKLVAEQCLEVTVWYQDRTLVKEFVSGLCIGKNLAVDKANHEMDPSFQHTKQWEEFVLYPGEWVEETYMLKASEEHQKHFCVKSVIAKFDQMNTSARSSGGWLTMALMFEVKGIRDEKTYGDMHVYIMNATQLQVRSEYSGCFVRTVLLPTNMENSFLSRRKTLAIESSFDPTWNEQFIYEDLTLQELSLDCVLEVTVWNQGQSLKPAFLGGLRIGSDHDHSPDKEWMDSYAEEAGEWNRMLSCSDEWTQHCYLLRSSMDYRPIVNTRQPVAPEEILKLYESSVMASLGHLYVGLKFVCEQKDAKNMDSFGKLQVYVHHAEELLKTTGRGSSECYVKASLLPIKCSLETGSVKKVSNPTWKEVLTFNNVTQNQLYSTYSLEVGVFEEYSGNAINFIGGFQIGPPVKSDEKHQWRESIMLDMMHWDKMLKNPNVCVKDKHALRITRAILTNDD